MVFKVLIQCVATNASLTPISSNVAFKYRNDIVIAGGIDLYVTFSSKGEPEY